MSEWIHAWDKLPRVRKRVLIRGSIGPTYLAYRDMYGAWCHPSGEIIVRVPLQLWWKEIEKKKPWWKRLFSWVE